MVTLSELFGTNRKQLEESINGDPNLKGVVREAKTFLRSLFAEYREVARDSGQARFAATRITHLGNVLNATLCCRALYWCGYWSSCEPEVFGSRVGLTPRKDDINERRFLEMSAEVDA
jgi:hypothetical protein